MVPKLTLPCACMPQHTTSQPPTAEMASNTKIAIALLFIAALMAANTAVAVRDLQGGCLLLVGVAGLVPACPHCLASLGALLAL